MRKTHRALRPGGLLLIIEPAVDEARTKLLVEDEVVLDEPVQEPNFERYLRATLTAIGTVIDDRLFRAEAHATEPDPELDPGQFLIDPYDSIDEWVEDRKPFCEDPEPFAALAERMRRAAAGRAAKVREYYREYRLLMRKVTRERSRAGGRRQSRMKG